MSDENILSYLKQNKTLYKVIRIITYLKDKLDNSFEKFKDEEYIHKIIAKALVKYNDKNDINDNRDIKFIV